ncbi:MAG: YdjY domain-containing protein [Planctomycetaceae bacterium]
MSIAQYRFLIAIIAAASLAGTAGAQSPKQDAKVVPVAEKPLPGGPQEPIPLAPLPDELQELLDSGKALNPEQTVFLDLKKKRVLLRTQIACNDCPLEMLCCPEGTKHHESILWVRSKAFVVHSALLALGMKPGKPVAFSPEFTPPEGPTINTFVNWVDKAGNLRRVDARTWMRHSIYHYYSHPLPSPPPNVELPHLELRYDPFNKEILWYGPMSQDQRRDLLKLWDDAEYTKAINKFYETSQSRPMTAEFVFAGSHEYEVDNAGNKRYAAEEGYLICVANFAAATIDVREASSADDGGQSYEAWTDRVPPPDTPVVLELVPEQKKPAGK